MKKKTRRRIPSRKLKIKERTRFTISGAKKDSLKPSKEKIRIKIDMTEKRERKNKRICRIERRKERRTVRNL